MKVGSGKVALVFDSKEEIVRCLDIASEYKGTTCEVTPWDIVVVPTDLAKICQKRGVRIVRELRVPTQEERQQEWEQTASGALTGLGDRNLEANVRGCSRSPPPSLTNGAPQEPIYAKR